ncbi:MULTISPECIES: NAD-dependent epimerase/dehydratase family protein [Chromobacterium]|uniref:NAD-dependent epimerase/dehydratase family protein n=1 Tax=Chromobacterium TaxID=535 RepID=UPI001D06A7FB|nr:MULTISPECIES: NAD(P)-dependent oxidoreductase [Chromobacterium]MCP1289069.1 NAD(P)-dependent oxidoreductase [Chromobacterium sp. S0633]
MTPQLNNKKILITGGTGFVGRHILDHLIKTKKTTDCNITVTILSRSPEVFLKNHPGYASYKWLGFIKGDLFDLTKYNHLKFTDIIHAAADTHKEGPPDEWLKQLIIGTQAVLDFSLKAEATRFLFISSGAVYGPQPRELSHISENYLGAPPTTLISSIYGQGKRIAEQLCTAYLQMHGLETVIARCFAFAGEHIPLDGPYAIGNFIRDALFGDAILIKGNGTAVRSYLDGDDMANWLLNLLAIGTPGEAYNVGSEDRVRIKTLAQLVAKTISPGKKIIVQSNSSAIESTYIPSTKKIQALGVENHFSISSIIERTANRHIYQK